MIVFICLMDRGETFLACPSTSSDSPMEEDEPSPTLLSTPSKWDI
jgi:hypothetical protein